jgi:hypothetical protein
VPSPSYRRLPPATPLTLSLKPPTNPPLCLPAPLLPHRKFSRKIATDKCIQLFFLLNFGLLIAIIVWYAMKRGAIKRPSVPSVPSPSF